ncbi:MAG: response regulator [Planctomycetales bacterium]|nr:response regulator [Planctomycetales bacterium]
MTNRRILIADDDQQISEAAGVRLRTAGYVPCTVRNGADAVATARRDHPDAIVLDVRMPIMDGLAALRELKSDPSTNDIPVVMLSASVIDEEAALDGGARYFIRKPFAGRALVEAVDAAMKGS